MVIARLIADNSDWKTRVDEMYRALDGKLSNVRPQLGPNSVVRLPIEPTVLELRFTFDDFGVALNILDKHFAQSDLLLSHRPIEVPKLFVSDMDSTMIEQECIDELADFAGLKDRISEITERAMQGELDFETALLERVELLKDLDESAIDQCLRERITPTPGARILTQTLKAHGARTVLVTGGFHHFADRVAEWLGFDRVVGNRLGVSEGKLTGLLDGPISDAKTKLATLREEEAALGVGGHVLASGDGANDIPMLEEAHYGFAYRAKPKAREKANGRVDQGDLTAILSLLGIPKEKWIGS
ncbi:MAG: phosphoserine phosphatase SerB [Pseudomonadota bacterium]